MFRKSCAALAVLLLAALFTPLQSHTLAPVKRDHLTEQEVELVREAQELDKRTEVFIRCAERRLLAINNGTETATDKKSQKALERWGPMPKGTRAELLSDFAKIIDEAITNIEDVAARDLKNPLISKSLRRLGAAANTFLPQINAMRAQSTNQVEISALERALEDLQQITAAANKLPPPTEKKDKKKQG